MADEPYAVIHHAPPQSTEASKNHFNNASTMSYTPASAASRASGLFPPASAISGRPPPDPPTFCATGPITLPACTRLVRSLVTPTIRETFPFDADPRMTTPDPILSR